MDPILYDDDDQIFEDDEVLRREYAARRCRPLEIDNDYPDPYGLYSDKD